MENNTFLEELANLVANENALSVSREVNELKTRFEDFILEEERKFQVKQLEAKERGENVSLEIAPNPIKDEFYTIYNQYKEKRNKSIADKNAAQEECLRQKRALITKLKAVVENEENIGAAFGEYKSIHEEWKKVGDIPRDKRDKVQAEYSRLLEDFFYNMKIYRELKEHDLHRNQQVKEEIVTNVKALLEVSSIKEVEKNIKIYQNEWEGTGPVDRDKWETLKKEYLDNVRLIYERINKHYDEKRAIQQENLEKKELLLTKIKAIVELVDSNKTTKDWEKSTAEVLEVQKAWKEVGFAPKKENEEIWKSFRAECDIFFDSKKAFYEVLRSEFDKLAEQKQKLIDQASELKDSTDWKNTTEKIIQLQKRWKSIGNAGQKNEQRLWKDFRAVCDHFFNAKSEFYAEKDKENEGNLELKKALITEMESYKIPTDKEEALAVLNSFSNKFNAIGHVPLASKDEVFKAYKTVLDKLYGELNIEGEEKEKILFEARINTLKASPIAAKLLDKEKVELKKKIEELKGTITQYENNLGFFANSKGANALKEDVEKKIEHSKTKIQEIKRKLKLIPNE